MSKGREKFKVGITFEISVPSGTDAATLVKSIRSEWSLDCTAHSTLPLGPQDGYQRVKYGECKVTARKA